MANWVRVAKVGDLEPGQGKTVEIRRTAIALFNVDGTFYAIGNACRHQGGPLAEGKLVGTAVICPWHEWRFDVTSGAFLRNPDIGVPRYNLEIRGDDICIEMP